MARTTPIPASPAFDALAAGAQFRDLIALHVTAFPQAIFRALREVTLADMPLARLLGAIRYLPARLAGRAPADDPRKPFLTTLVEGGTLVLEDDAPREVITGSAGRLHRIVDQAPVRFETRAAFDAFGDPGHEKLFMSIRVVPDDAGGGQWLVLEHATLALSSDAERKFRRYWRVIRPAGAFVTRLLLKAIDRRARLGPPFARRSVRASVLERTKPLPGDDLIAQPIASLTHAVAIDRAPHDVWPWLAQMGAGSRAGWYSYDRLDNGGYSSALRIVPELQHLAVGMIFPWLPGATAGFMLLAFDPERFLILGMRLPDGTMPMTWAFVLDRIGHDATRLIVRARAGPGYDFHGLPWWLGKPMASTVHFVMQRKQLLGIARRAELTPPSSRVGRKDAA